MVLLRDPFNLLGLCSLPVSQLLVLIIESENSLPKPLILLCLLLNEASELIFLLLHLELDRVHLLLALDLIVEGGCPHLGDLVRQLKYLLLQGFLRFL